MNKVIQIGYLSKKGIELRYTPGEGKAVAGYCLAVPRDFQKDKSKKEYDYVNCVTWNGGAEWLANNQSRVKRLLIEGKIRTRTYEDQSGIKRYVTEVITEKVEVIEWSNGLQPNNEYTEDLDGLGQDITPIDDGYIPF